MFAVLLIKLTSYQSHDYLVLKNPSTHSAIKSRVELSQSEDVIFTAVLLGVYTMINILAKPNKSLGDLGHPMKSQYTH